LDVFNDLIVLRAQRFGEAEPAPSQTRVYDRATLLPVSSPVDQFDATMDCGPVVCGYAGEEVAIVDASDFTVLWRAPLGQYPWWTGSALMLSGVGGEQSRGIVDPRTGRLLINLENWNLAGVRGATPERISLWLTRFVSGRTDVALLEPSGWRRIGTL